MNPVKLPDSIYQNQEVVIANRALNIDTLLRLQINKLISDGRGLARYDGMAVFVKDAVPGETVEARVIAVRSGYCEAQTMTVVESSQHRVQPPCRHFGECGGCTLQHISAEFQRECKHDILLDALQRIGKIPQAELPARVETIFGSATGYRNRMRCSAGDTAHWGMRAARSNEIIPLEECVIAHPRIQAMIAAGKLPDSILPGQEFSVYSNDQGIWFDAETAEARVANEVFRFPADSFFQSNQAVLEKAIPQLCGDLPTGAVADLYGGVGLLARFCAAKGHRCVSVDTSDVPRPRQPGIDFRIDSVERWIRSAESAGSFGTVFVDPPRTGLSKPVRNYLSQSNAEQVRYLSCNPDTFARDAGQLIRSGRRLHTLMVLDFYPHTSHMEVFGVFAQR